MPPIEAPPKITPSEAMKAFARILADLAKRKAQRKCSD